MDRHKSAILFVALYVSLFLGNLQARATNAPEKDTQQPDVGIRCVALRITPELVELRCDVVNNTGQDIWVYTAREGTNAAIRMDEDHRTIVISRSLRFLVDIGFYLTVLQPYTRLGAGRDRGMTLPFHLPTRAWESDVEFFRAAQEGVESVTRLAFEIGYYTSRDLDTLKRNLLGYQNIHFDESGDQMRISAGSQDALCRAERAARVTLDGLHIPYKDWLFGGRDDSRRTPLRDLQTLFYGFALGAEEYRYAQRLFSLDESLFDGPARQIAGLYAQVAEGKLNPAELTQRLDNILNAGDRERLLHELQEKQAAVDLKEQARITELLAKAKALDNPAEGRQALALLRQVLAINPSHGETLDLMQKIGAYYQGEVMTNSLGMQLVWIPPGQFLMGKKVRQHRVRISRGFWMGVYEVTQAQYEAVMGRNPGYPKGNTLPVDYVSWHDATEFCQKLSPKEGRTYRLPTEAEWEYACRAGTQTDYWWGDTPEADPNKANGFGLFNMHDGVAEWCQDWYSDAYYVIAPQMDPQGPRQPQVEPQAPKPPAEQSLMQALTVQSPMQPQRPRGKRVTRGNPRSDAFGERWPCFARGQQPPEKTSARLGFRVVLADD